MSADARGIIEACRAADITLATAESLTAGLVAATLAEVPGCSTVLRGGVVAYATEVKRDVLHVPAGLLDHVVSQPVAVSMARGAASLLGATMALATTGVAGPADLDGQPPGTAWIAVHDTRGAGHTTSRLLRLHGDRASVRGQTVIACLELLAGVLRA
ncbi:MAG: nicotinamide-nucleotide amidohydrolase family protein [Actinomycetales bacterium]|nr:nicotinamide-nucleotide amidohydrolase family protein [Actinomycetales bacterium]